MSSREFKFVSSSPEETALLGERVALYLKGGDVIALRGVLGSGKTCFTKGIARGLSVTDEVTSPTYTIISEYPGSPPLYHIDAYRLAGDQDFENTGGLEIISAGGISVIEWSEKIPHSLPEGAITVTIEITGPLERLIRISGMEAASGL